MISMTEGENPRVQTAASLFQELCYSNKDNLSAGIIVAGVDKYDGPSVWSIPLGGSLHRQPFSIGGSGSTYIYGYCDANYKDGMTREEAIEFTKNCEFLLVFPMMFILNFVLSFSLCLKQSLWPCRATDLRVV